MYDPASLTLRGNVDEAHFYPGEHDIRVSRWDYRYYELQLPYTLQPMEYSVRNLYADYYGNVTWLDDNIGKVLKALDESGQRDNTIVVFTADHGDNLGSHGRNGKGLPYDESLLVPMIYSHPTSLVSRVDEENIAGLIDVAPTILASAGIAAPDHMAGTNVMSDTVDVGISEMNPRDMVARTIRFTAHMAMRPTPLRLAFFDNINDPCQLCNLVDEDVFADEKTYIFDLLKAYHDKVAIMPKPEYNFR